MGSSSSSKSSSEESSIGMPLQKYKASKKAADKNINNHIDEESKEGYKDIKAFVDTVAPAKSESHAKNEEGRKIRKTNCCFIQ